MQNHCCNITRYINSFSRKKAPLRISVCNELGFQGYSGFRKAVKKEVLSSSAENLKTQETPVEAAVDNVIYHLLSEKYPRQEDGHDQKIREGVFTRFNPYGVIEPDSGKKAPEF